MTDYHAYGCRECQSLVFARGAWDVPDDGCPTCGYYDDGVNEYVHVGRLR